MLRRPFSGFDPAGRLSHLYLQAPGKYVKRIQQCLSRLLCTRTVASGCKHKDATRYHRDVVGVSAAVFTMSDAACVPCL